LCAVPQIDHSAIDLPLALDGTNASQRTGAHKRTCECKKPYLSYLTSARCYG
jgi:hypothetical protein